MQVMHNLFKDWIVNFFQQEPNRWERQTHTHTHTTLSHTALSDTHPHAHLSSYTEHCHTQTHAILSHTHAHTRSSITRLMSYIPSRSLSYMLYRSIFRPFLPLSVWQSCVWQYCAWQSATPATQQAVRPAGNNTPTMPTSVMYIYIYIVYFSHHLDMESNPIECGLGLGSQNQTPE
jgi:hypothetical protein